MSYYKIWCAIFIVPAIAVAQPEKSWVKTYNASGDFRDCSYAIAVDKAGYIYITGQGFGKGTQCDFTTFKYAPNGEVIWMKTYNSPESGYDKPYALAVDDSGYIYVTGCGWGGEASFEDIVTIKYASNGNEMWTHVYDGPAKDFDSPSDITVDKNFNVYVTGESYGGDDTFEDIVTIKYDQHGNEVWVERYDGPDHDYEYPTRLAVDDNFNVYVTGLTYCLDTDEDMVTIKYAQPDELRKYQERMQASGAARLTAEQVTQKPKRNKFLSIFRRGE